MFARIEISIGLADEESAATQLKEVVERLLSSKGISHTVSIHAIKGPSAPRRDTLQVVDTKLQPKGFKGRLDDVDRQIIELRNKGYIDLEIANVLMREFGGSWLPVQVRARINDLIRRSCLQ